MRTENADFRRGGRGETCKSSITRRVPRAGAPGRVVATARDAGDAKRQHAAPFRPPTAAPRARPLAAAPSRPRTAAPRSPARPGVPPAYRHVALARPATPARPHPTRSRWAPCSARATGPGRPLPTRSPSSRVTGITSVVVPVRKSSEAAARSARSRGAGPRPGSFRGRAPAGPGGAPEAPPPRRHRGAPRLVGAPRTRGAGGRGLGRPAPAPRRPLGRRRTCERRSDGPRQTRSACASCHNRFGGPVFHTNSPCNRYAP